MGKGAVGLANLALAINLAARVSLFPEEYAILLEWQYATGELRGAPAVVANQVGLTRQPIDEIVARVAGAFNLEFVGSGRRNLPFGYCRIPSSMTSGKRICVRKQLYMARYAPRTK